jgi:hypothetical protein
MEDNIVLLIVVFDAMEIIRSVNSKEIVVNLFLCMNWIEPPEGSIWNHHVPVDVLCGNKSYSVLRRSCSFGHSAPP